MRRNGAANLFEKMKAPNAGHKLITVEKLLK